MARTDDDLLSLFKSPESANLERKRNANDLDRLREIICGFANDIENTGQTGIVIIGQEDDLSCSKTNIDDELLKTLAGLRSDGRIQPLPMMNVAAKTIDGCKIAVIEVFPSDNPPVRCNGRTWIRIGPTRAQATPAEEKRLVEKRVWGSLSFDAQTCKGATIDDLDLKRFQLAFLPALVPRDVLIENHRDESLQLCSFRLVDRDNRPTNAGILFLAKSVLDWIPSAYIQFRRVDGTELTDDTLDAQQIMGTLPNQLQQLDNLLPLHIRKITRVGGNLRNEESDYPIVALRQLVRNAVIHRAYDGTNSPTELKFKVRAALTALSMRKILDPA